ncbi:MAG TPA: hypothetical protein VGL61_01310 [Kofleriaceae bacterium]
MIQRFCFVKLEDADVGDRDAIAAELRAELAEAGADATVGVPADDTAARWDLAITITAASHDAWRALALTPAIVATFDKLAARAHVVKAWTFKDAT